MTAFYNKSNKQVLMDSLASRHGNKQRATATQNELITRTTSAGRTNYLAVCWSFNYDSCYVIDKNKGRVRMISL